jgi:serine/threonine protein kinase
MMFSKGEILGKYIYIKDLAEGSFGTVALAKKKRSGDNFKDNHEDYVAIKHVYSPTSPREAPTHRKRIKREVEICHRLNHLNVIKLLDSKVNGVETIMVFEHVPNNLADKIKAGITITEALNYMKQILTGLCYVHDVLKVIHRDIKPANILQTHDGVIKIADFGLAREFAPAEDMSHQIMSRWYRAPEILFASRHYDFRVDIWSCGCIMAEMLTKRVLFKGSSDIDQICVVFDLMGTPNGSNPITTWPDFVNTPDYMKLSFEPKEGRDPSELLLGVDKVTVQFILKMLHYDYNQRSTAAELLREPGLH